MAASKKSGLVRWPSRSAEPVLTDAVLIVAVAVEASTVSPIVRVPSTSVKRPRTLVTMAWRATKPTSLWEASMA